VLHLQVDTFLTDFDSNCPKACVGDLDQSFNALLAQVERDSEDPDLPVCKTCEWIAGECVGGIARFALSTCGSTCAETVESLAADEGYRMRAPLEAVVQCNGGWAAPGSTTLHANLAAYVANAWVTCNPQSNVSSDAFGDHICQLGYI
jgi:hypothetical protein